MVSSGLSQAVPAVGDVGNLPRATAVAYASGSSEAILVAEVPQSRAELCSDNLPVTGNQPASGEERDSSLIECIWGEHSSSLRTGSCFGGPRCQVRTCRQWEVAKQAPLAHCAADAGGLARINITVQLRANTCTARLDCAQAPKKRGGLCCAGPRSHAERACTSKHWRNAAPQLHLPQVRRQPCGPALVSRCHLAPA